MGGSKYDVTWYGVATKANRKQRILYIVTDYSPIRFQYLVSRVLAFCALRELS